MHHHDKGERADGLVPLARLLRARDGSDAPPFDEAAVAALGARLEHFVATLPEDERRAVAALMARARGESPLATLGREPPHAVLDPDELSIYERLAAEPAPSGAPLRSTLVMVMKATRHCNLRCAYCHFWREGADQVMPFEVLVRATRDALRAPGVRVVEFAWHGGETTLLPWSYYRKALWLQQQFRQPGQRIKNAIQTNGTRLDDAWIEHCREYELAVGVSLDGPPEIHDRRRRDAGGRPTAALARRALERLAAAGVAHGALLVVDDDVIEAGPERLLHYFLEIGVEDVGILNALPDNNAADPGHYYLPWTRYVDFLRALFRVWWPDHVGKIRFREIMDLLGKVAGQTGQACVFAGDCMGMFLTIEPSGQVFACDKYLGDPDYVFGNLRDQALTEIVAGEALAARRAELTRDTDATRACPWFEICRSGCPHDRYVRRRFGSASDEDCCGLSPLLEEIAAAWRMAGGEPDGVADTPDGGVIERS